MTIFKFMGQEYELMVSAYAQYERQIEMPIMLRYVESSVYANAMIHTDFLEVGNCLSNVFAYPHDVVDKYEQAEGIINEDIETFSPGKKYSFIISISTIEHIGRDEGLSSEGTKSKLIRVFDNLQSLLYPTEELFFTIPIGYNPVLDLLLFTRQIPLTRMNFMKKFGETEWREVSGEEAALSKYNEPFLAGNAILFGGLRVE